jgi:hypothetical protein
MAKGDHIYINCGLIDHHGIDCGDGTVIHLSKVKGKISRDTISSFASASLDGAVYAYDYDQCFSPSVVIQRAISRLGESGYNLFGNNCEHFATWCKTGQWESQQVDGTVGTVGGTTTAAGLGAALGAISVPTAAPGILGFLGMTTTAPLLGIGALPLAAIFGGAYIAYKIISDDD